MKYLALLLLLLVTGCVSSTPAKFESQVENWVPVGTPLAKAQRTMGHKGFDCSFVDKRSLLNSYGIDYLDCTRQQVWFHDWSARFFFENGKVTKYGHIGVE